MNDGEPIEIPERNSTLNLHTTFNRLASGQIPIYAYGTADGYANPFDQKHTVISVQVVNASASKVDI